MKAWAEVASLCEPLCNEDLLAGDCILSVCLSLWKTCLSTQRWIIVAFMLNGQFRATSLFSTASADFLFYLHLTLNPLILNREPGLLPDFPNLILEYPEDRSDWCLLPWGPASAEERRAAALTGVLWRCQPLWVISKHKLEYNVSWNDVGQNRVSLQLHSLLSADNAQEI